MAMDFGVLINKKVLRIIKGIMSMIRNQGMEHMNGKMDGFTKVILKTIIVMDTVNFTMEISSCTRDTGKMVNKLQENKE